MSSVRKPRTVVRVNGTSVSGLLNWTVNNNSFYEADTYEVELSASGLPKDRRIDFNVDEDFLSRAPIIYVEILAGFPSNPDSPDPNELQSLIYGRVDNVEYNLETVTLTGRDLTGALIDKKISQTYLNQKPFQIIQAIAQSHLLGANIVQTTQYAGSFSNNNSSLLIASTSEWDLITRLAQQEGFIAVVQGKTLYFGPDLSGLTAAQAQQYVDPSNSSFYGIGNTLRLSAQITDTIKGRVIKGNFNQLELSANKTVASGISVTVRSAGAGGTDTVSQSYPRIPRAIGAGQSTPFGATTNYYFNMPAGANPFQAQQRAQQIYNQIVSHAMKVQVHLPGDVTTSPFSTLAVSGTLTAFDQSYYVTMVERHMDVNDGFSMNVSAQNTNPNLPYAGNLDLGNGLQPVEVTAQKISIPPNS